MADETKLRSQRDQEFAPARSATDSGRPRRGPEDPLAELARLIGQEDPFAEFSGGARPRARPAASTAESRTPVRTEPRYEERERRHPYRDADVAQDRPDSRAAYNYGAGRREEHPLRSTRADTRRPEPEDRYARTAPADQYEGAEDDTRADAYDPEYSDEAYLPEHGEEVVEQPRLGKVRRLAIYVTALVIGVGVVGAAGMFGYRAVFGPTTGKNPPVISPKSGPNKVVPPTASTTPEATKQIYDRLGPEPANNERIVPRAETPIDIAARTGRVPDAPAPQADPAPVATTPGAPVAAPAPVPTNIGPRRVRTVTVRSDGTIVADPTPATPAAPPAPRPAPAPRSAVPAPAQPLAVNTYAEQPQPETAPPPGRTPPVAAVPAPTVPAARVPPPSAGPIWPPLQPQTAARPTGPVSSPVRVQTQAPTIQTPQTATGYVVQVSSQRSEAEAQAAWRALQARYGSVLGGQQATIHRADLGERGTFYRAQIGPFASRDEAARLCQNLKTAGGECIVQRN